MIANNNEQEKQNQTNKQSKNNKPKQNKKHACDIDVGMRLCAMLLIVKADTEHSPSSATKAKLRVRSRYYVPCTST